MEQEKIGKFIQELRRQNKMTQQELADKLNVTDRAISHWENGRRLPDISLFKPICEIFNISVNELISGERIDNSTILRKTEENIINTLNINKKNKKKSILIIGCLVITILVILYFAFSYYRNLYPKFDIYNISVSDSQIGNKKSLKKQFEYKSNYNIWYYGVDEVLLCDSKNNCYKMKSAILHNQISIDKLKQFLDFQTEFNNLKKFKFYDEKSKLYSNDNYSVLFCDTIEGNKEVYIGNNDMLKKLGDGFCGKKTNISKEFIRTYRIVSVIPDNSEEYINVVITQFQSDDLISVKIPSKYKIEEGKNYEFKFINYYRFEDTIKNIFEYSTIVEIKETSRVGMEQINESIYLNN